MRVFFSIEPPPDVVIAVDQWRQLNWPLLERCVPPSNYHLTLVFAGELNNRQLEQLHERVTSIRLPRFSLTLDEIGLFEKSGIFWTGPAAVPQTLGDLVAALESACHQSAIPLQKRPYRPHLTLARRCVGLPSLPMVPADFSFGVDAFSLMESVKHNKQVIYQPVFEVMLEA